MISMSALKRAGTGRLTPMASALALTMLSGLAVSATPFVLDGPGAVPANAAATRLLASPAESGSAFYTVLLREAPLATYAGEIAGLAAPERLLRGSSGGKLDLESSPAVAYVNHLRSRQETFVANLGASLGRTIDVRARMQHALNAVIVELTSSEAAALSQNPDVLLVEREHQLHLDTDNAPTYTGAPSIWDGNTSSGAATKGEGIVVGVVDTGINWQSPAYAAVGPIDGYVHQNPRGTGNYLGLCGATAPNADLGRCNDKLIGMYNFAETSATRSGQDTQGHGSHTSSTVAGNRWAATFASGPFTISGVAPHANIISYLACPSTCPSTATSQSVNQAVIDGVDVLNYSISGGTTPWTDTTSIAFRNANAAGMFVATSAGNTSTTVPDPQGQVNHMEPWVETVAASTQNRVIAVTFDLDGGPANTQDVPMRTGAPPLPTSNLVGRPVIKSPGFANGATDSCTAFPANTFTGPYTVPAEEIFKNGFDEPVAPPTTVGGIAVLRLDPATSTCASGVRRTNAINAGAAGVIFVDTAYINLGAADTSWSMLLSNWNNVEAALVPGTSTGSVDIAARSFPAQGDLVAGFSFRGPRLVGGQGMVKPDITAPGVDILAVGAANVVGPNGVYLNNGTSMSSPHMAGAAALMRALNPSWTPPQIKSALNLSSNNFGAANQDGSAIRLWDYGSGRVNLTAAAKVGLIMDETAANFLAANPATGGDIASLNLASMAKYNFTGSTTFTRTFRRAKAGSQTYTLGLAGLPAGAATFSPASFSINSSGSRTVTVTVNSALLPEAAWTLGELILTPGAGDEPTLHLPIAVYPGGPQIAVAPSSLSGTSDTTVSNNLTISNTANPTLNWQFQTTGTAVVTPFNTGTTSNGQQGGYYVGTSRGYHWSQNFDVAGQMKVTTLRANGFTLPSTTALSATNTPLVIFSIYADNAGSPAGAPEGFGAPPLWTYSAAISAANGITTTGGAISLNLNAANVAANPLNLPAGRYWMTVSPRINGTGAQTATNPLWAWYVSDAPLVGNVPKLYAPWSDPLAFSTAAGLNTLAGFVQGTVDCTKPAWVGLTTTSGSLGLAGSQTVPVTFDAAGLSAGTYTGSLCVTSNATNTPVVSVPLTFTVPNGGSQAPTVTKAFAPASVSTAGTSALTITLANAGSSASTLSAPLVDTFPSGLVIAATPAAATTCPSGVVTAVAGAGSVSLAAGAQIPATGSCTVTVNVSSASAGSYVNTIAAGALQTSSGNNAAPATATLTVTLVTYTVTPSVNGSNGTIAPATPQTVNSGATTNFALTPNSGYQIGTVGGTCGGTLAGTTYTTAAVVADCTVIANFTLIPPLACASGQPVEVVATGGTTGPSPYSTLKGAFDAINAGTHTGALDVSICANTTETASAVLNASGTGSAVYTAATIKPAGGGARTVSGALAAPLVDLNGADNVTIDGLNTGGNALTISNTDAGTTSATSTIRLIGGATGNTVTRSTILGSATMPLTTNGGVVFVSTGDNDNNTISGNNIGPAGTTLPTKLIYGNGSTTTPNNGITIDNNNLYDFFNAGTSVAGIYVNSGNDAWTISNNRIYQTAARTFTAATPRYSGIVLATTSTPYGAFTVTGNRVGFGAADGTGTTSIGGSANTLRGIEIISVNEATATSVQGNVISGIVHTTTSVGALGSAAPFIGLMMGSTRGLITAGDVTGNKIGSLDGSSTIVLNANGATAGSGLGILNFGGATNISNSTISNNEIGAITVQGTGTTAGFYAIFGQAAITNTLTITNNIVGGPTAAGAIVSNHAGLAAGMFGIRVSTSAATITGNTVRNLTGNSTNGGFIIGMGIAISTTSTLPSTIRGNTIHSLVNNSGATNTSIYALYPSFGTATNVVERNFVHSIVNASTNQAAQIAGILPVAGTATYANNMVRLGHDAAGVAQTSGITQYGIFEIAGTNLIQHNSVYVGGSSAATASNTFAFVSNLTSGTRTYQNNIFWNAHSTASGLGKNYAALYGGTTPAPAGLTASNNDLHATGTVGFIGRYNLVDYSTISAWQAATGVDANSFSADPQFIAATGSAATANLHISPTNPTAVEGSGIAIPGVTDDFDGELRSGLTPTDVGADAGNFVPFVATTYTVTPSAGANGAISPSTAQTVNSGATTAFTLTPNAGYAIGPVSGTCPAGSLSGGTYTTGAITANCTVIASFTQITYTVTPSAGANGSISPNTPQTVNSGASQAFTLTPNAGFAIGPVTGTCPTGTLSGGVYTTGAIVANCTVIASFTQITYTVTPSAGANGSISPSTPQTVNSGATTAFTLTPDAGFAIGPVTGTCPNGPVSAGVYTTGPIVANCTVIASFIQITYTVTPSVGTGPASGTITPNTPQTVNSGATTAFTLAPASGYSIGTVTGTCGGNLSGTTFTTDAATDNCTVIANFILPSCPVQNFDADTAPALPAGWIATAPTGTAAWTSISTVSDTAPNSAFSPDLGAVGERILTSPLFSPAAGSTLIFRNRYNMESTFDGGVLEVAINGGAFQDVTSGGGFFVSGGYSGTIAASAAGSTLIGRAAWTGSSAAAFVTSAASLPPAAAGQSVQIRWRMAEDNVDAATAPAGWWVDSVSCGTAPPSVTKAFSPATVSGTASSTLTISLASPGAVATLTADLVDTLPTNVTVAPTPNAATSCPSGTVTAVGGGTTVTLATGAQIPTAGCSVTVSVQAGVPGLFTNTIAAGGLQTNVGNSAVAATALLRGLAANQPNYSVGFESPFTVGALGTQQGWGTSGTAANATISNALPAAGTQHLRLTSGTGTGASVVAAISPTQPVGTSTHSVLTSKIRIVNTGAGATWELNPQDPVAGVVSTLLRFDRTGVRNIQMPNFSTGSYVNTGATWPLNTYFDVSMSFNRAAGSVEVCINGITIYQGTNAVSSPYIGNVFARQSGQSGNTAGNTMNIDDLVINNTDTPPTCLPPAPTVTKAFSPSAVDAATPSTLTISFGNPGSTATLTSVLTDTFPSGLVVAPTPGAATTCPSGSVTAAAGSGSISLNAGAQIPQGGCNVTVSVQSAINGGYTNTIAAGALQTNNGSNAAAATATLSAGPIVYSGPLNIVVPADGNGVYFDFAAGTTSAASQAGSAWNPYGAGQLQFFWPNSGTIAPGGVAVSNVFTVLASGAVIGPASTYSTTGTTAAAANFRSAAGVNGYLGVRFTTAAVVKYGYVRLTTAPGTTGHPATVLEYAYDRTGAAITIP